MQALLEDIRDALLALCTVGIILGIPCALIGTRLIRHVLFGVGPGDPLTFVVATAMLLVMGTLAGCLPARRAAKVAPMTALRCE